jgi:hypothetical protein
MKSIRFALSVGGAALLMLGYFGSQYAYFQGDPSSYAARLDEPPVRMLATFFFLAALVLAFVPDRNGDPQ